jgi:hypothetical protein
MPIKVAAAPKNAMKLLQTGITQHLAAGLVDATLGQIESMAAPHRVFHLGIDALVGEKAIAAAAKHVGWRAQLLDRKKQALASAELVITRTGLRFANVSRGPHAAASGEADAAAERWSREAKVDHELALLRIPGAYCTALWLRSSDGKREAFVPIAPCPPSLRPNTVYSESELRAVLLPEARKQLDAPREGGG